DDALAERANPLLREAVHHHVADIEVSPDPGTLEFIHISDELRRAEQELVPDLFDRDDDAELLRKRDEFANLLLRARPRLRVIRLGIDYRRDEQHRIRAPQLRVAQRGFHALQALRHVFGIAARER